MTELIEINDIVTDAVVRELRQGDRVQALWNEHLIGTVMSVNPPMGDVIKTEEGATAEVPPIVAVYFGPEEITEFTPQFLRVVTWRWQCVDLKRV